jgi:hypothetical protein
MGPVRRGGKKDGLYAGPSGVKINVKTNIYVFGIRTVNGYGSDLNF